MTHARSAFSHPARPRVARSGLIAAGLALLVAAGSAIAQPSTAMRARDITRWSEDVWSAAARGEGEMLADTLVTRPIDVSGDDERSVFDSIDRFSEHRQSRETLRAEGLAEARLELTQALEAAEGEQRAIKLSEALRAAVRLQVLMREDPALLDDEQIRFLTARAEASAHAAERESDWLTASELFIRLNALYDHDHRYRADVERLEERLRMISLYNPERLWELRNARRLAEGEDGLPPYNATGEDYRDKLDGISERMVRIAIRNAANYHVEGGSLRAMIDGGLHAIEVLATTDDLEAAFPGLSDAPSRERFLGEVRRLQRVNREAARVGEIDVLMTLDRLQKASRDSIGVPQGVVLREFGNGAMAELDRFSQVIWPDEVPRFNRLTSGRFVGVGISIQMDEQQNIRVVTPLIGTPAQRAGIQADDLIKGVNGDSTVGFTLDQAVDVITGDPGTNVRLTVEREIEVDGELVRRLVDFDIERERIELVSVKGWARNGPAENDWDWFIDRDRGVGYVRVTSFSQNTTREFDRAVMQMRQDGLNALIVDLRHNPGGLLDQAVSMASRFVSRGLVVSTETGDGTVIDRDNAVSGLTSRQRVNDVPVVVLVNEGSASASEILSGAIQDYASEGGIDALIVGDRTFGKGSVQNVLNLGRDAKMKLTTFYYRLRGGRLIHRRDDSTVWGVEPDLTVEMLPQQVLDALVLRRDADVVRVGADGRVIDEGEDAVDPASLLTEGHDLQLQAALVLLQSRVLAGTMQARAELTDNDRVIP